MPRTYPETYERRTTILRLLGEAHLQGLPGLTRKDMRTALPMPKGTLNGVLMALVHAGRIHAPGNCGKLPAYYRIRLPDEEPTYQPRKRKKTVYLNRPSSENVAMRVCLKCRETFRSEHVGNRLCDHCSRAVADCVLDAPISCGHRIYAAAGR